jgi:hypothetical protein
MSSTREPLDLIEDALIDAKGTAALLTLVVRSIQTHGEGAAFMRYTAVIERHLSNDMEALRRAFTDASHKHASEKLRGRQLAVIGGAA